MKQKDLISIIIPVYNEGKNIFTIILQGEKTLHYPHEYSVIYDLENDTSLPYVKQLIQKKIPVNVYKNEYQNGVTNAVKTGFIHANGNIIVVMTPDGADDPQVINEMYKQLLKGFDVVCATRYAKGGKRLERKSVKYYLSQIIGLSTPLLLGVPTTDITNGFKMYKRRVIKSIPIESKKGWEFSMELVIKAHHKGFLISEVAAVSKPRTFGKSKFKLLAWLPFYIKWLLIGVVYRVI